MHTGHGVDATVGAEAGDLASLHGRCAYLILTLAVFSTTGA